MQPYDDTPDGDRSRLAASEPDVEVLLAEVVSPATLRLFIDHPEGVSLALCERVSGLLTTTATATRSRCPRPGRTVR